MRLAGIANCGYHVAAAIPTAPRIGGFGVCTILVAALLAAAMLWALRKPQPHSPAAAWSQFSPLVLRLLILGPYWLCSEVMAGFAIGWKALASIVFVTLVGWAHACSRRRAGWSALRYCALNAVLLVVVSGTSMMVSAHHRAIPPLAARGAPDPGRPPVVVISLDTTVADHLSAYEYPRDTTPFLTEFARTATLFRNATSASDMTLSSHASMFTGVYASWHGAHAYSSAPGAYAGLDCRLWPRSWRGPATPLPAWRPIISCHRGGV